MKSALINEFGGPDVIVEGEARLRQPQANEVVVRIEAASVNPLDVKILAGYMQPIFPGGISLCARDRFQRCD